MIKQCSIKHCQENIAKLLITTIIIILRLTTEKETCLKLCPVPPKVAFWYSHMTFLRPLYKMLPWHEYHL